MIHKDKEKLLHACLNAKVCEGCGIAPYRTRLEPHHVFITRGACGSDFLCNISFLDRFCHTRAENDARFNRQLRCLVAVREKVSVSAIEDFLKWYRRQPKGTSLEKLTESAISELDWSALELALRELG